MKKFIVLYQAKPELMQQMSQSTPEEQAKGMEEWMNWAKKCGDKLVDLGAPLTNAMKILPDGKSSTGNNDVAGYSVLQASSLDEAKSLLKGHPHLTWDASCSIEIHETMPIPGA